MNREFQQIRWDETTESDCRQLVRMWAVEDLGRQHDWTTLALVGPETRGAADVVAGQTGVVAGLPAARVALDEMDTDVSWVARVEDGKVVEEGDHLAQITGSARDLLTVERLLLNLIGRLSGIATLTRQFVNRVAGATACIYDTRKTTPGWRRLEKYAVTCGGGRNHRTGLFDAILVKDNHLAVGSSDKVPLSPAAAVHGVRRFLQEGPPEVQRQDLIVEIEVDTLAQLKDVLAAAPDIILLDNMSVEQLRQAVAMRNAASPQTQLEASGGARLETVRSIAETGVDRISVGSLTHSAGSLDVRMDWKS